MDNLLLRIRVQLEGLIVSSAPNHFQFGRVYNNSPNHKIEVTLLR